jgi:hypothetical protein
MTASPYTVHRVDRRRDLDGLLAPEATCVGTFALRSDAQTAAARLIRDGVCQASEVRQRRRLLDTYVLRGERTPAHIYSHKTRTVQGALL